MAEITENNNSNNLIYKQLNIVDKSFSVVAVAPEGLPGDSKILINGKSLTGCYTNDFVEDFFVNKNNLYVILKRTILSVENALNGNLEAEVSIEIKDYYCYENPQMFVVDNQLFAHIGGKLWLRDEIKNRWDEKLTFKIGSSKPLTIGEKYVVFSHNLQSLENINGVWLLNVENFELKNLTINGVGNAPFPIKYSNGTLFVEDKYSHKKNVNNIVEAEIKLL